MELSKKDFVLGFLVLFLVSCIACKKEESEPSLYEKEFMEKPYSYLAWYARPFEEQWAQKVEFTYDSNYWRNKPELQDLTMVLSSGRFHVFAIDEKIANEWRLKHRFDTGMSYFITNMKSIGDGIYQCYFHNEIPAYAELVAFIPVSDFWGGYGISVGGIEITDVRTMSSVPRFASKFTRGDTGAFFIVDENGKVISSSRSVNY
jgi:hypothetical protein